jgi:dethiobiotin synthetase
VGKTVVSAAIVAALRRRGIAARGLKPVLTGLDEPPDPVWPRDHELLAAVSEMVPPDVVLAAPYGPPVSPHLAAELAGRPLDPVQLRAAIDDHLAEGGPLIVEGVGGLLVPLTDSYDVRALAADTRLPLLIAARPGLGTINHTLLTLAVARQAGLEVAGVVVTPWPDAPAEVERSNRRTIERLGGIRVSGLPAIDRPEPDELAAAGERLPLEAWLARGTVSSCA